MTDFLRWCVEFVGPESGFKYEGSEDDGPIVYYPSEYGRPAREIQSLKYFLNNPLFPLLILKVIDACNSGDNDWIITQFFDSVEVVKMGEPSKWFNKKDQFENRLEAVKDIWERSRNEKE